MGDAPTSDVIAGGSAPAASRAAEPVRIGGGGSGSGSGSGGAGGVGVGGGGGTTRVKVCVRIRPPSAEDLASEPCEPVFSIACDGTAVAPLGLGSGGGAAAAAGAPVLIPYTAAFGPTSETADIYAALVQPITEQVASGFNGTVLAYG